MAKRRILVTGGAGYIGVHTAYELIQSGFIPVIVDNLSRSDESLLDGLAKLVGDRPPFIKADCTDLEAMSSVFKSHGPIDGVMHFAALKSVSESVDQPLAYYKNNLLSITTVLEVMRANAVTDFIFSSSCTVYGQPEKVPVREDAAFKRAESPYGATKQMSERILEDASRVGFRTISLRYFNPIGAHPSSLLGELPIGVPGNLVPYITQTAIGKREKLTVFGNDYQTPDGTCVRDFIHVMDIAAAHVKALQKLDRLPPQPHYDAFNLGVGRGVSVMELVKMFEGVTGVKLNYVIGSRRPGDVECTFADPGKANAELDWQPSRTIEQGLLDAWNWERHLANLK